MSWCRSWEKKKNYQQVLRRQGSRRWDWQKTWIIILILNMLFERSSSPFRSLRYQWLEVLMLWIWRSGPKLGCLESHCKPEECEFEMWEMRHVVYLRTSETFEISISYPFIYNQNLYETLISSVLFFRNHTLFTDDFCLVIYWHFFFGNCRVFLDTV